MKRKLFWVLYFTTAIFLITLAALLMPEHVVFNWYSLFPVGYILSAILLALFFPSKLNARFAIWYEEQWRIKWGSRPLDDPFFEEDELVKMDYNLHIRISKTFLLFIPFWMLFIIFCTNTAKILSILVVFIPTLIALYLTMQDVAKTNNEIHAQLEKERREQEQREQWGRWK